MQNSTSDAQAFITETQTHINSKLKNHVNKHTLQFLKKPLISSEIIFIAQARIFPLEFFPFLRKKKKICGNE